VCVYRHTHKGGRERERRQHAFTGSFVTQLRESERESEHTTVRSEHTCTGKRVVASIEYIY